MTDTDTGAANTQAKWEAYCSVESKAMHKNQNDPNPKETTKQRKKLK